MKSKVEVVKSKDGDIINISEMEMYVLYEVVGVGSGPVKSSLIGNILLRTHEDHAVDISEIQCLWTDLNARRPDTRVRALKPGTTVHLTLTQEE